MRTTTRNSSPTSVPESDTETPQPRISAFRLPPTPDYLSKACYKNIRVKVLAD